MRFVFWQDINSPLQFALLDALSRHPAGHTVELVVTRPLTEKRIRMKWREPEYEYVTVHRQPSPTQIDLLTGSQVEDSVHIFSGLDADPMSTRALRSCISHHATIGVMAECGDWNGHDFKRYPRLAKFMLQRAKYGRHISFILAMGDLGVQWYTRVGYSPKRIYPFAYYVEKPRNESIYGEVPEILFIGRATGYKGGDLLLRSLSNVKSLNWHATLVTEGQERNAWEELATQLNLKDRVKFRNFEPSDAIAERMASASMLVLPNTGDEGWGAVVNEALMQGTPVICTTLTGAKDMVGGQRGMVAPPTVADLTLALESQIQAGPPSNELRDEIAAWTRQHWSGAAGAQQLTAAVNDSLKLGKR